jgi:hypothetical protein
MIRKAWTIWLKCFIVRILNCSGCIWYKITCWFQTYELHMHGFHGNSAKSFFICTSKKLLLERKFKYSHCLWLIVFKYQWIYLTRIVVYAS